MRYKEEEDSGSGTGEELEDAPMPQKKPPAKPFTNKDRKHLIRPSSPFVGMNKKPYKPMQLQKPLKPKATLSKDNSPMPKANNAPQRPKLKSKPEQEQEQDSADVLIAPGAC